MKNNIKILEEKLKKRIMKVSVNFYSTNITKSIIPFRNIIENNYQKDIIVLYSIFQFSGVHNNLKEKFHFYEFLNCFKMMKYINFYVTNFFDENVILLKIFNDLKITKSKLETNILLKGLLGLCLINKKIYKAILKNELLSKIIMYKTWDNIEGIIMIINFLNRKSNHILNNSLNFEKEISTLKDLSTHECIDCRIKECLSVIFKDK